MLQNIIASLSGVLLLLLCFLMDASNGNFKQIILWKVLPLILGVLQIVIVAKQYL